MATLGHAGRFDSQSIEMGFIANDDIKYRMGREFT